MLNRNPITVRFVNIHVTGKVILKDTKGYIQTKKPYQRDVCGYTSYKKGD